MDDQRRRPQTDAWVQVGRLGSQGNQTRNEHACECTQRGDVVTRQSTKGRVQNPTPRVDWVAGSQHGDDPRNVYQPKLNSCSGPTRHPTRRGSP